MFDGIENVSSNQGGAWLQPGQHLFKILALKQPPNLRAGNCFIAELEVVETTNEDYSEGQSVSWIRNVTKHKEMALSDIKAFLAAVAGCEEEEIDSKGANAAVSDDQPFAGHLVKCEAFNRPTAAGGTFTRTLWSNPA
jgi:hypothetical protein